MPALGADAWTSEARDLYYARRFDDMEPSLVAASALLADETRRQRLRLRPRRLGEAAGELARCVDVTTVCDFGWRDGG